MTYMITAMAFPQQLAALRKARGLTQTQCAKAIGVSMPQLQRYEAGTSQPTLDVIKSMAVVFNVPADALIFEENERGPAEDMRLLFEAVSHFTAEDKQVVRTVLESMTIKNEADRWHRSRSGSE